MEGVQKESKLWGRGRGEEQGFSISLMEAVAASFPQGDRRPAGSLKRPGGHPHAQGKGQWNLNPDHERHLSWHLQAAHPSRCPRTFCLAGGLGSSFLLPSWWCICRTQAREQAAAWHRTRPSWLGRLTAYHSSQNLCHLLAELFLNDPRTQGRGSWLASQTI